MLTREQVYTMLMLRNREGSIFSGLPTHIIQNISDCGQDPNNDISKALTHAAYARKEDVDVLLAMLDKNPRLLLQAGNVKTPCGLEVQRVTIYEFVLGAGDIDLANQVFPYFSRIKGGEEARDRQLERYRPHLEGMLTQVPYDIRPIFNLLLNPANNETIQADVNALLDNNLEHESELRDAIMQFRNAHLPTQPLIKPRMHFNYATQNALYQTLYSDEIWSPLYETSGNNYNMIDLIWLKMICYLMNFYPGIDRCIMAQGITYMFSEAGEQKVNTNRSYRLRRSLTTQRTPVDFPDFGCDTARGILGEDFGISISGHEILPGENGSGRGPGGVPLHQQVFNHIINQKYQSYRAFMQRHHQPTNPIGCVIL